MILLAGTIAADLLLDSGVQTTIPGFLQKNDFTQYSVESPFLNCVSEDLQSFCTSEAVLIKSYFV